MKKGGKAGVGKKKAGKKAGVGLKPGEKPLLSAAESLAIQSAVLPPQIPKPEESKAPIEALPAEASPLQEPGPKSVDTLKTLEGKAETSLPPVQDTVPSAVEETPKAEPSPTELGPSPSQLPKVEERKAEEMPIEAGRAESTQEEAVPDIDEALTVVETSSVSLEVPIVILAHEESPVGLMYADIGFGEIARITAVAESDLDPPDLPQSPTALLPHEESPTGLVYADIGFGEIARIAALVGTDLVPDQPEFPLRPKLVDSSAQTPPQPSHVLITPPTESPPRAASPVLTARSRGHSKHPSSEGAPQTISRIATETYESLDDFASKIDPPLKKFPTFQPDSSDMMSFDDFLTTIDESPKAAKSTRNSINITKQEEEIKQKFAPIQPIKALKRVSVKPVDPQIDKMKQLAKEKEAKRAIRVQAATKIQARVRGIIARKRYLVLRKRYEKVKIKEKLEQLREAIKVSWAPYRIYKALKVRK